MNNWNYILDSNYKIYAKDFPQLKAEQAEHFLRVRRSIRN